MNELHNQFLASEEWREMLRDMVFPFAFRDRAPADLGDDVLEVGPGPGLTTDLLRAQLPRMTALELDADLAAALAGRLDGGNVDVRQGDATAMPFESDRFSGAVSFTMLHHVPSERQDALFAEVRRVLRPGGVFVANDSIASLDLEAFHADDMYSPVDPTGLEERLRRAGFDEVDVWTNEFAWAAHALRR